MAPRINLTVAQRQAFRKFYPVHFKQDTAKAFGISVETVQRLARDFGLTQDAVVIKALRKERAQNGANATRERRKGRPRRFGETGASVVKRLWPDHTIAEIIAAMPEESRYWHCVTHYARKLGLEYDGAKLEEKRLHAEAMRAKLAEDRYVEWAKRDEVYKPGTGCYDIYAPAGGFCTPPRNRR